MKIMDIFRRSVNFIYLKVIVEDSFYLFEMSFYSSQCSLREHILLKCRVTKRIPYILNLAFIKKIASILQPSTYVDSFLPNHSICVDHFIQFKKHTRHSFKILLINRCSKTTNMCGDVVGSGICSVHPIYKQ